MMDSLNTCCKSNPKPLQFFKKGLPCGLFYEDSFYRGEIISDFSHGTVVQVKHIDYGFIHMIDRKNVFIIPSELLSLPRQAIHCGLKGFENERNGNFDGYVSKLKSLPNRQQFYVNIFEKTRDGKYILHLKCEESANVVRSVNEALQQNEPENVEPVVTLREDQQSRVKRRALTISSGHVSQKRNLVDTLRFKIYPFKPKRYPNAFTIFMSHNREAIKLKNPNTNVQVINSYAGKMWRELKDKTVSF